MKIIINGKLYDTETAELVAVGPYVEIYHTKRGSWFEKIDTILGNGCQLVPIDVNDAKSLVGVHSPDRYEKYFGRAEEA